MTRAFAPPSAPLRDCVVLPALLLLVAACGPSSAGGSDQGEPAVDLGAAPQDLAVDSSVPPAPSPLVYGFTRTGGTSDDDQPQDIAVAPGGEIYFASADTITMSEAVTKLAADGTTAWSVPLAPPLVIESLRLAVDGAGTLYVAGAYPNGVALVMQLHPDGSRGWTRSYGAQTARAGTAHATGVAVGPAGEVVVVVGFSGTVDFGAPGPIDAYTSAPDPETPGAYLESGFILRLRTDGSYAWTRLYPVAPRWVGVDASSGITVGGEFSGEVDFDWTGGFDVVSAMGLNCSGYPQADVVVTRATVDGDYGWTQQIHYPAFGQAMGVDAAGNVFLAGTYSNDTAFDPGPAMDVHKVAGNPCYAQDLFVTRLASDGSYDFTFTPVTLGIGGFGGLVIDDHGGAIVGGDFKGTLDFLRASTPRTAVGLLDAVLEGVASDDKTGWGVTWGGGGNESVLRIARNGAGRYAVLGAFDDATATSFDFTGRTSDPHTTLGARDWFITTFTVP